MMTSTTHNAMPAQEQAPVSQWLHLVQAEYREMPCLSLTKPQMQRLWGLERPVCDALVAALIDAGVLRKTAAGSYVAVTSER